MRERARGVVVGALAALSCARSSAPADERPVAISIHSGEVLWQRDDEQLTITRNADGWVENGHPIDDRLVRALVAALSAPVEPALNPARIRPFLVDLEAQALARVPRAPQTAKHLAGLMDEPRKFGEILNYAFSLDVSHDEASLSVDVSWSDGRRMTAGSTSRAPLMLPWWLTLTATTWNPDISAAIAALLPAPFRNRDRVAGKYLTGSAVWSARALHKAEVDREEAEERYGAELAPLHARFRVEGSTLEPDPTFNVDPDDAWCGELHSEPAGEMGFDLCLTAKEKLASLEPFLRDADALRRRVNGLAWFQRYKAAKPNAKVFITYFNARSLSDHALSVIHYALERVGKLDLERKLRRQLPSGLGLRLSDDTGHRTWIVLPDRRSMFFEHVAYPDQSPFSVGTLIDQEGQPLPAD